MEAATILVVDDEQPIVDLVSSYLTNEGFVVHRAYDGPGALALARSVKPDLVVLDVMLPGLDGLSLLRRIRGRTPSPAVMILTARGAPEERVRGLDLGADDYLSKPFDVREFEARVRSLLRRQAGLRSSVVRLGGVELDLTSRQFAAEGVVLDLPPRERALLELFFQRAGKVVAKEAIVQSLTSLDDLLSDNAIEQYVSRLRRRIAPYGLVLRTVRGLGYLLEKPPEVP